MIRISRKFKILVVYLLMKNALFLQKLFNSYGYTTLAAGGFVRDYLLNIKPKDIDLATQALPLETYQILLENNIKVIETGLQHGTLTAVLDNTPYEITTLRVDQECLGRKANVEFVSSFEEDAKRRDLTINALFMDLETKQIYDYVGGQKDLLSKTLRFVGDPEKRIQEDYLRLLRYYRFAAKLGFILDDPSIAACKKYLPYLCYISQERIRDEFLKMLLEPYILDILECHKYLVTYLFPELIPSIDFPQNNKYHIYDVYTHTILGIPYLAQFKDPILSLAHLLHDAAKPLCFSLDDNGVSHFYDHQIRGEQLIDKIALRLKLSSNQTKKLRFIVKEHMRLKGDLTPKSIRHLLKDCIDSYGSADIIFDLVKQNSADYLGMGQEKNPEEIEALINHELQKPQGVVLKSPLSGSEIMEKFNLTPSPKIKLIKEKLINYVIEGVLDINDKEKSFILAKEFIENNKL